MAETVQEAMKRVLGKQRPLYRGNALLTTQHLQYFKPLKTPQNVLDENILLKEVITVNPLTSVVEVKGHVLLATPLDKGKYTKTYRTWINDDITTGIFEKLGLETTDTVLAVNVTKDYYDPETFTPIKGWNSEQDRYLVRRSIDPNYMEEISKFKIESINIEYNHGDYNYGTNDNLGKMVSRDATITLDYLSENPKVFTGYNLKPTDTSIENRLFPRANASSFNHTLLISYEYEFTPKYNDTTPDIISFYEELVKGTLWNSNPEYVGRNPEEIKEVKLSYKFKYDTRNKYGELFSVEHDLYNRIIDENHRVKYVQVETYLNENPSGHISTLFVKVGDQYKFWTDWTNENIVKTDSSISVRGVLVTKGSIDSENYFNSVSNLDTELNIRNRRVEDLNLTKDKDYNTYRTRYINQQNHTLLIDTRNDVTNAMQFGLILNGAFNIPDDSDKDYRFTFEPDDLQFLAQQEGYHNKIIHDVNKNKLESRINQFKESIYYWDESENKELDLRPFYTERTTSSWNDFKLFNTNYNNTAKEYGLRYLFENTYIFRNQIPIEFNGVDKYGRKNVVFKRRKFLEAYNTLRCRIASLISGIGTYTLNINIDKKDPLDFTQFYLGGDNFDYSKVVGLDTITPTLPIYDRVILGKDDPSPAESFLLTFPIAKRMDITYKGVKYTFENSVFTNSDYVLYLDKPIDEYGNTLFVPSYNSPAYFLNDSTRGVMHFDNINKYYNVNINVGYPEGYYTHTSRIERDGYNTSLGVVASAIMNVIPSYPTDGNIFKQFSPTGYTKIKNGQQPANKDIEHFSNVFLSFKNKTRDQMLNKGHEQFPENEWQEYINWCVENDLAIYFNGGTDSYTVMKSLDIGELTHEKNEVKVTLYFNRFGLDPYYQINDDSEVSRTYITKGENFWYDFDIE